MTKTNAMRLLDIAKIKYSVHEYEVNSNNDFGSQAASGLDIPIDQIFKTLVTRGDKNGINVFCIPISCHLDLKKAAIASNNKNIEMLSNKEVLPTAGYMVGSCSPIAMKKQYPTYIDETAILYDFFGVSAGAKGLELELNAEDLASFINAEFRDLTKE